jgi:predicted RNA-binding protein YlxR (DUF448 family)
VTDKENMFAISEWHTEGRGAYICRDKKCVEMAIKKKALNRSFKCEVPKEIYEKLGNHPASQARHPSEGGELLEVGIGCIKN